MVSLKPWSLTPQRKLYRRVRHHGVNDTAKLDSAESMTPRNLLHLRISPRNQNHMQKYFTIQIMGRWVKIVKKQRVKNLVTLSL